MGVEGSCRCMIQDDKIHTLRIQCLCNIHVKVFYMGDIIVHLRFVVFGVRQVSCEFKLVYMLVRVVL